MASPIASTEDTFHLGIKALIRNAEGNVLILQVNPAELHHEKRTYWDLPGGRIQRGEQVIDALKREVEEETGITDVEVSRHLGMVLSKIRIPIEGQDSVGLILSIYECQVPSSSGLALSFEHTAHKWVAPNEAADLLGVKFPDEFCELVRAL